MYTPLDDAIIHGHTSYLAHVLALGHLSADDNDTRDVRYYYYYNDAYHANRRIQIGFGKTLATRGGALRQIFVSSSVNLTFNILYNEPPPVSRTIERAVLYMCTFSTSITYFCTGSALLLRSRDTYTLNTFVCVCVCFIYRSFTPWRTSEQ